MFSSWMTASDHRPSAAARSACSLQVASWRLRRPRPAVRSPPRARAGLGAPARTPRSPRPNGGRRTRQGRPSTPRRRRRARPAPGSRRGGRPGSRRRPTRRSIAVISRLTSELNDSCRMVTAWRLASGASSGGSSERPGITAPSTSTGITGTSRSSAATVSATTQSPASSSRRWPWSSFTDIHWAPITDRKTSQSSTACRITSVKSVPGSMVSMSMKTWNRSTNRSARRPATWRASWRR